MRVQEVAVLSTRYNIIADQAATYQLNVTWKDSSGTPVNLTGYTAKMQVRLGINEPTAAVEVTNTSGIVLGGSAGTIAITISATQMTALTAPQTYVYDLRLTSGDVVTRLIDGTFTTVPAVTRG